MVGHERHSVLVAGVLSQRQTSVDRLDSTDGIIEVDPALSQICQRDVGAALVAE
jgi:hypothetical protein